MGWMDVVVSVVSSAVSVVSSVVSSIGSVIAKNATSLLKIGMSLAGKMNPIFNAIGIIAQILGIFKPKENVEEIGAKAMKSDKTIDDFDSVDEYMQHLRDDIQLSKEELENATEEKKLARKAIGASIALSGISEKKDMDVTPEFMAKAVTKGLSGNDINDMLESFKDKNLTPEDFIEYVNNRASTSKEEKMDDLVENIIKKSKPELSESEIELEVLKFTKP